MHLFSFRYLVLQHGYWFLFVYTLAATAGLPLPADPIILLMGALVGNHQYSFLPSLAAAVIAGLLGDTLWYQVGRFKGHSVLGFLCKLSLEPDTCVRKTEGTFAKRGPSALLLTKFVPGMSLVSAALAGASKIPYGRFLLADAAGCTLWAVLYLSLGRIFHRQTDSVISILGLFGRRASLVSITLLALYLGLKYVQRWRFLRKLRINRITPQEALARLDSTDPVMVIDLRDPIDIQRE